MLVNLVDINVLMLLWANLSRHLVRCMLRMLRRVISCHLQVNPAKRHVLQEHSAIRPVRARVQTLLQATMFLAQPKRARLLVLQEPTTRAPAHPVHQPAQMPTLDITFHLPANLARRLVLREPIKQAQDNPRVTMLIQATMFLAQPKRARLLVLQEPTTRAPVHPVHQPAQMPTLDITFHLPANRARPLVQ